MNFPKIALIAIDLNSTLKELISLVNLQFLRQIFHRGKSQQQGYKRQYGKINSVTIASS
jgi:hypothetical protein